MEYDRAAVEKCYKMFCKSVDSCLTQLYDWSISDDKRRLLEQRVRVTFLMTDYSVSALDDVDDSFLDGVRDGVNKRKLDWGHYRSSSFDVPVCIFNKAYVDAWAEEEVAF